MFAQFGVLSVRLRPRLTKSSVNEVPIRSGSWVRIVANRCRCTTGARPPADPKESGDRADADDRWTVPTDSLWARYLALFLGNRPLVRRNACNETRLPPGPCANNGGSCLIRLTHSVDAPRRWRGRSGPPPVQREERLYLGLWPTAAFLSFLGTRSGT